MAASALDKFRKYKSLFSTTLSTGIGTGTSDTITPATVTGLPTDTGITLTIDRVDSSGTATPSKMERITGVISGGNLIDYVRGVDGTTEQSHSAGAVVEMVWNSADLNALIDGFIAEHSQSGAHGASLVTSLKAAASDVTAGTSDTTITTPKALKDAGLSLATTGTLSDNSDVKVPSQKAVKTYVDSGTVTFTNKRITPRLTTAASYTTNTGTSLNCDTTDYFEVTAQAGALKFNNPTGTPTNGQKLWISVTGTGARALTWDTQYEASAAVALPSTTVTTARLDIGFVWRADTSKWHCVASA